MDLHRGGGGQLGGCMDLVEVAVDDWEAVLTHEQAVVTVLVAAQTHKEQKTRLSSYRGKDLQLLP